MTSDDAAAVSNDVPDGAMAALHTTEHDRRRTENKILMELSATFNTLTSISQVLDDMATSTSTISHKQELLLQELRQWKDLT